MAAGLMTMALLLVSAQDLPDDVWPINQRHFQIPIRIDPARRQDIRQLMLYSSTDQGRNWSEVAVVSPDKDNFQFYAPTDGLYWFNLVIVDNQNRREPSDVRTAPPAQKILVDTVKPMLRIVSAERRGDDVNVSWEITDENLDPTSVHLEYQPGPGSQWYTADIVPTAVGQGRFRLSQPGTATVKMTARDRVGNSASTTAEVAGSTPQTSLVSSSGGNPERSNWDTSRPGNPPEAQPTFPPVNPTPPAPDPIYSSSPPAANPPASYPPADTSNRLVASSDAGSSAPNTPGAPRARGPLPPPQVINSKTVSFDYELRNVGPSGIGKVELWLTQDDGRSWRKFVEDLDGKPPISAELPDEGVYGLSLIVQSRAGLGRKPPMAGDAPDMRVEVDTTPPEAKLYAPEPEPRKQNTLVISWSATDRNLAPNPITLQWTERPGGTWETIGADLPNSGRHNWSLPANMPYQVYLRLIVRDSAGNTAIAETPTPILVDLAEPEGRILGITGISSRR